MQHYHIPMRTFRWFPILWLVLLVACGSPTASNGETTGPNPLEVTATARAAVSDQGVPTVAPPAEPVEGADVPAGRNEDGTYYLGSPDAPVTLIDYSDFL